MTREDAIQKLEAEGYSRQLLSAAKAGLEAALSGSGAVNPYPDKRTPGGRVTFSRSFRTAWARGHSLGQLVLAFSKEK